MLTFPWINKEDKRMLSIYNRIIQHPFIEEIKHGTLSRERFLFYLRQDAIYLNQYKTILQGISKKLTKSRHKTYFLNFIINTIKAEKELHHFYKIYSSYDIIEQSPSPICSYYIHYLTKQLTNKPIEVAVASILPCFVIYYQVGNHIYYDHIKENNPYQQWINTYSNEEFKISVNQAIFIANDLAKKSSLTEQLNMTNSFIRGCELEYFFLDSSYHIEH